MTVTVICPNSDCCQSYSVSEEKFGERGRCKKCGTRFTIEASDDARPPAQPTQAESQGTIPIGLPRRELKKLGRFEVKKLLGAGAFGEVFRAHDPQLEREVALKVPHAAMLRNPKVAKRFLIEARATARLTHPNIVPVFDAGRDSGHHYIASAFIEGKALDDALTEAFDFRESARIVMKLAGALNYAHEQGIIHRDIKPANILLDKKGEPHLVDFGLARLEAGTENLTHDGAILGTPAYMPPEQATGDLDNVSAASDQYSLGVTLYEMLCGERPFSGPPEIVIFNVINQEPPTPRSISPDVPRDLETICLKAMAKNPQQRYPSCAELVEDLRRWEDSRPISARRITLRERFVRWSKRNPLMAGMMAIVAAVVMVGMFMAYQAEQTRRESLADLREARAAYVKQAALAYRLLKDDDIETMNVVLESCPERLRHWEWYYLWNEGHSETASLAQVGEKDTAVKKAGGPGPNSPEENSDDDEIGDRISKVQTIEPLTYRKVETTARNTQHVAISRGGRTIATSDANMISLWDGTTGSFRLSIDTAVVDIHTTSIALNSDGTRIAATNLTGGIQMWDTESGKVNNAIDLESDEILSSAGFKGCAFSSDGRLFICWGASGSISPIFNVNSGKIVAMLNAPDRGKWARCAEFSPSGSQVVTGNGDTLLLWNVSASEEPIRLIGHSGRISCALFTPDGQSVISGGGDSHGSAINIWDASHGKLIRTIGQSTRRLDSIVNIAVSPDGARIVIARYHSGLTMWDVESGVKLLTIKKDSNGVGQTARCLFSPDGQRLILGENNGLLHFWDAGPAWNLPE